jgi:Chaperone of endosialidase
LGSNNTGIGAATLLFTSMGSGNIAVGYFSGNGLDAGDNNIYIGSASGGNSESNSIHIGENHTATYIAGIYGATASGGTAVYVNSAGQLGTATSSRRFKDQIKPMEKASEALFGLNPVTFRYKKGIDPKGIPQFGLVAEEVEKVNPDLVVRDAGGKVYTVRYEAVNAMLLNEFLKEHRKVEEQEATITQVKSTAAKQEAAIAEQQQEIKALTASVKQQAAQIQKVSDQLEVSKATPKIVVSN